MAARTTFPRIGEFPDMSVGEFIAWYGWAQWLGVQTSVSARHLGSPTGACVQYDPRCQGSAKRLCTGRKMADGSSAGKRYEPRNALKEVAFAHSGACGERAPDQAHRTWQRWYQSGGHRSPPVGVYARLSRHWAGSYASWLRDDPAAGHLSRNCATRLDGGSGPPGRRAVRHRFHRRGRLLVRWYSPVRRRSRCSIGREDVVRPIPLLRLIVRRDQLSAASRSGIRRVAVVRGVAAARCARLA